MVGDAKSPSLQQFKENEGTVLMNEKLQTNDPQKLGNAIIMEINFLAGQLFELSNNLAKLVIYKPKKVYKILLEEY